MVTFELRLMPAPRERLTPKAARAWLREDLFAWLGASRCGYELEDAADRDAFAQLSGDVHTMAEACWAVLDGRNVAVRSDRELLERECVTDELARIADNQPSHSNGDFEQAFDVIRARLARRRASRRAA